MFMSFTCVPEKGLPFPPYPISFPYLLPNYNGFYKWIYFISSRNSSLSPPFQRSSNYNYRESSAVEQRSHYPQPIRVSNLNIQISLFIFSCIFTDLLISLINVCHSIIWVSSIFLLLCIYISLYLCMPSYRHSVVHITLHFFVCFVLHYILLLFVRLHETVAYMSLLCMHSSYSGGGEIKLYRSNNVK